MCIGVIFFIHSRGKALAEERFSRLFDKPVTIERMHLGWPLRLQVDKLLIPKIFSAKHVSFSLGFLFSSSPQVILTDVIVREPVLYYVSAEKESSPAGIEDPAGVSADNAEPQPSVGHKPSWRILIRNLFLQNGQVVYRSAGAAPPLQFEIKEMEIKAENVTYPPEPQKVLFDFEGRLMSPRLPFSGNLIHLRGWLDYPALSMDAKAEILQKEGAEGVLARIKSVDNDMKINGKINLKLLSQKMQRNSVDDVSLTDMVLGSLQSSGLEPLVDFEINTQMNNIRLEQMDFSGNLEIKDLLRAVSPAPPVSP